MPLLEVRRGLEVLPGTCIEHVMRAVVSLSDRIVVLDHGEKILEGDRDTVRDQTVVRAYLGNRYRHKAPPR